MPFVLLALVASVPCLPLCAGLISTRWANLHSSHMRRIASFLMTAAFLLAIASTCVLIWNGPIDAAVFQSDFLVPISVGVYFDSLSAIMLLLVSFIGCIITRFSQRYLEGEATQGRFLRWICFTLGSVLLLVVSRNLLMFTGAWMMTSFGLHQLLTHYSGRAAAILAARKKFVISRLGDIMLVIALVLTYRVFGTLEFSELFASAKAMGESTASAPSWSETMVSIIATLFVIGAMTKSAQFPFHTWLPDTLETPTPVSALMHAGIINAGGFLVIRLSPLVSLSQTAMIFLSLVGAFTALLGVVVMMTQTSVKRSLAYSTMAQMGFMMLQCGLGAFSAALLHIVAHSLYKAHTFLSSGSVLEIAVANRFKSDPISHRRSMFTLIASGALAFALLAGVGFFARLWATESSGVGPGAWVLGMVLAIAATQLIWQSFMTGHWQVGLRGVVAAAMVMSAYFAAFLLMDRLLASSVSHSAVAFSTLSMSVVSLVAIGFCLILGLQIAITEYSDRPFMRRLYVHASNGFYFDITVQRIVKNFFATR